MTSKISSYSDYSKFSFEEFLRDDFFISSIVKPTPETTAFWSEFRERNENSHNFYAAKDFIESINIYNRYLSSNNIEELRKAIHRKVDRKKRAKQLLLYSGIGATACITLLIIHLFWKTDVVEVDEMRPDIEAFAGKSRLNNKSREIQLVLSDQETIFLEQEETTITYDTAGITVDEKNIGKSQMSDYNQLLVPLGKRSVLNLADGTKVWINSDTRLIYPVSFAEDSREIFVDGEVFIDVVADATRPFIVKTKDLDIQVLGTKLNVMAYEDSNEKKIVLVSGSVQVNSKTGDNFTRLTPDQMYVIEDGISQVHTVDTEKYTSWIHGIYYCQDESLGTILQRLSRYYGIEIECSPSISAVLFSGKLDLKDSLPEIFDNISFSLPISYVERDGKFIISKLK